MDALLVNVGYCLDNLAHFVLGMIIFYDHKNIFLNLYGLTWLFITVNYKQNVNGYPFALTLIQKSDMNNPLGLICHYGLFLAPTKESIIQHPIIDKFHHHGAIYIEWSRYLC